MNLGVLIGVMGLLTVVCVYFWLVRSKSQQSHGTGAGPEHK